MSARLLFREPLEKETRAVLIGQIAKQEFEIRVSLGTRPLYRATDEHRLLH